MKTKVYIKDINNQVSEEFWDIPIETIEKFKDENGNLYAIFVIENGEKKHYFLKKDLWDAQEELDDIFLRSNIPDVIKEEMAKNVIKRKIKQRDKG